MLSNALKLFVTFEHHIYLSSFFEVIVWPSIPRVQDRLFAALYIERDISITSCFLK